MVYRLRACIVMNRDLDPEVAEVLSLVRLCQGTRSLPKAGGLLDQDSYFVYLFEQVMLADQIRAKKDNPQPKRPPGV